MSRELCKMKKSSKRLLIIKILLNKITEIVKRLTDLTDRLEVWEVAVDIKWNKETCGEGNVLYLDSMDIRWEDKSSYLQY